MRLPRDLSGTRLVALLRRYGYQVTRETGSHMRLTSTRMGTEHHITVPRHKDLRPGTLNSIFGDVALYIQVDKLRLIEELFMQ